MLSFTNIGSALRSLRRQRGWKQAEVAQAAGITSPMLSAYETGKQRPSFATIDKILMALRYDATDLARALRFVNRPAEEEEHLTVGPRPHSLTLPFDRLLEVENSAREFERHELELAHQVLPALILLLRYLRS